MRCFSRMLLLAAALFASVGMAQSQTAAPGTVPLMLYWSAQRGDNFTTATAQGQADAQAAGYAYVRVEGYVFPAQ